MKLSALKLKGLYLFEEDVFQDQRGSFEVFWETEWSSRAGSTFAPSNAHHSYNPLAGTLRGLHYQVSPDLQVKLVSCVAGKIWDVVVDLRKDSPTFHEWVAIELEAQSGKAILIPQGCAHGFLTMADHATIAYLIEGRYRPASSRTVRWNDPILDISWPVAEPILSECDRKAPLLNRL